MHRSCPVRGSSRAGGGLRTPRQLPRAPLAVAARGCPPGRRARPRGRRAGRARSPGPQCTPAASRSAPSICSVEWRSSASHQPRRLAWAERAGQRGELGVARRRAPSRSRRAAGCSQRSGAFRCPCRREDDASRSRGIERELDRAARGAASPPSRSARERERQHVAVARRRAAERARARPAPRSANPNPGAIAASIASSRNARRRRAGHARERSRAARCRCGRRSPLPAPWPRRRRRRAHASRRSIAKPSRAR